MVNARFSSDDRKALQRWTEHHKALAADVPVDDWMSRHDIEKRRRELERDPIAWIRYFFPKYSKYDFAPFHIKAIHRIIEHGTRSCPGAANSQSQLSPCSSICTWL